MCMNVSFILYVDGEGCGNVNVRLIKCTRSGIVFMERAATLWHISSCKCIKIPALFFLGASYNSEFCKSIACSSLNIFEDSLAGKSFDFITVNDEVRRIESTKSARQKW